MLENHPLYFQALLDLQLVNQQPLPESSRQSTHLEQFTVAAYEKIAQPAAPKIRFKKLEEIAKELITFGSSNGEHLYRTTMLELNRLVNKIKNGNIADPHNGILFAAPNRTKRFKGRPKNEVNCSALTS